MNKLYILILIPLIMSDSNRIIFDFKINSDISQWRIIDDVVMGGRSEGSFKVNKYGHGEFYGFVSLENNGGFSSLRYNLQSKEINNYKHIVLRVKGDGKNINLE